MDDLPTLNRPSEVPSRDLPVDMRPERLAAFRWQDSAECSSSLRYKGRPSESSRLGRVVAAPVHDGPRRALSIGERLGGYLMLGHNGAAIGRSGRGDGSW